MKKLSVLLGVTGLVFAGSVSALPQTKYTASCKPLSPTEGEYPESNVGSITSQSAFKKITAANEAYADGRYAESIALLKAIIADSGDKAAISRSQYLIGVNYNAIERYNQAAKYFTQALKGGFLGKRNEANIRMSIARVHLIQEDYQEAIKWMKEYFANVIKPPASAYMSYSQMFYQLQRFEEAICPAYIALEQGYSSKEGVYSLLFGAHFRLGDYAGAETIGEEMIELFPEQSSAYSNLFAVYSKRGKRKDMLALSELARMNGTWTKDTHYKQLSALFANNKIPQLAAERLKEGIEKGIVESNEDNWKRVAENYDYAKDNDNAIESYEKASSFTSSGKYTIKIANILFYEDEYRRAIQKYQEAFNKGGVRKSDLPYAYVNMGQAQFRLKQYDNASRTMKQAAKYPAVSKIANGWIAYIDQMKKLKASQAAFAKASQENNEDDE